MKHFRTSRWSLLTVALPTVFLLGCFGSEGDGSISDLDSDETLALEALNDPYAKLGTNDESPLFGDTELEEVVNQESQVNDNLAFSSLSVVSQESAEESDEECTRYALNLRWGQFRGRNDDITEVTDWSGKVFVNVGRIEVKRTIAFDAQDEVLERTNEKEVAFISKTLPHFDGLRLGYKVCESDLAELTDDERPSVTFESTPITKTYGESDLIHINDVVDVDDMGNKFQFLSIQNENEEKIPAFSVKV